MQRAPALSPPAAPVLATAQLDLVMLGRRALGLLLALLTIVPVYRLLSQPEAGLAGAMTVQMADAYREFGTSVLLIALAAALLLARGWTALETRIAQAGSALARVPGSTFALGCALLGGSGAFAFSAIALHGEPNLIDATAQLIQARYLAAGQLAGPANELNAFWHVQQSVVTPAGWVAQYPPGHIVLLALGYKLGLVQLVGPLLLAVAVYFSARTAELIYPEQKAGARLGGVLIALSPFLVAHAGAYMSHTSAAAFLALALYAAVKVRFRGPGLLLCGLAFGALATIRPLTAATAGAVLFAYVLSQSRTSARSAAWLVLGTLPFLAALAAYNAHFFGSAIRFGYDAALGEAGTLGFGVDPWGNTFGLAQAIAYTAAELVALNLQLLETAIPAVLVIALFLLLVPKLEAGDRLLLALIALPLLTHLFYWHHGLFMGPRMLNEYAPLWCLLFARAATRLPLVLPETRSLAGYTPRSLTGATVLTGGLALVALAPMRLASYAAPESPARATLARVQAPALVFVHGGWEDRIGMLLAASGMRLDSVETLIRQNPTCAAQLYADARLSGQQPPRIDFRRRAVNLPERREAGPGSLIRAGGEPWPAQCRAQAQADRAGVIDPARLFLHNALPGAGDGVIVARDLGPRRNDALIQRYGNRPVYLLHAAADGTVTLDPYATSIAALWGEAGERRP